MKYLCLDFGGTGVKYAIIDENFQLYDVNKENKIFQSHDEMITWVVDLFKTIHMKLSGIAISYCGEMNPFTGLIKMVVVIDLMIIKILNKSFGVNATYQFRLKMMVIVRH